MAQTKTRIQSILASIGSHPRHRFGQNFMIDQNLLRLVAEAGRIEPTDRVIEVGPGTGTLTEELLARAGEVVAVEIDRDLAAHLRAAFSMHANFRLIEGDALAAKHQLNSELLAAVQQAPPGAAVKLVANLPYNIASPLVIEMLIAGVDLLVFTVQKEVAQRLAASVGDDDYGPLTIMAKLLAEVEILRTLPPQAFWPTPKIESALVRMVRRDRLGADASAMSTFVHALFGARRKMLRKALAHAGYDPAAILDATGFDGQQRPEQLSPEQMLELHKVAIRYPFRLEGQ